MKRSGQSLIEVLVAIALGAIFFAGTAALVAPSLQINKATNQIQVAAALGNEMLDNARVWSEGNWHAVLNLATTSANTYYFITSSSPFSVATGTESIQVSTTTYTRSFYLSDVYRDANGNVTSTASSNLYDPSTKKMTILYNWTRGATTSIVTYLTRNHTSVFDQTDWSGGSGFSGPTTSTNAEFATSTGMNYASPEMLSANPPPAVSGWPNGYVYRRVITVSSTLVAPSGTSLSNFPMLVSGTYSYLAASSSGGSVQNANGYDVIFTSDASGTIPLSYERESYASSTGAVNYWVKVPTLSSSSNQIYMFYDNASTTSDQSNATGTWNSNYQGVWHFESGNPLIDSTGNGNTLSAFSVATTTPSGIIDGGATQNGNQTTGWGVNSPSNGLYASSSFTYSLWVNPAALTNPNNNAELMLISAFVSLEINATAGTLTVQVPYSASYANAVTTSALTTSTWQYVVLTYIQNQAPHIFINGHEAAYSSQQAGSGSQGGSDQGVTFGAYNYNVYVDNYNGLMDESRISSVALSPDWIATEYNNQSNPSNFYTIGSAVTGSGGTSGVINASTSLHWAWNDTLGWIDFYNSNNVSVDANGLHGYASSSIGAISLDCATSPKGNTCGTTSTYQVVNDGSGDLSGWAWNDAIGWISFCGGQSTANCPGTINYETTIDSGGNFQGWAWNDAIGWISFNCDNNASCGTSNYEVKTTWLPPAQTATGQLDSPTFDTGVASGAQFNSILWQGIQTSGSTVQFQFAASNSSSGPWTYSGPDGTSNTYYTPTGPNTSIGLNDASFNNFRYFRYRIFITYANGTSSRVKGVVVNWSP